MLELAAKVVLAYLLGTVMGGFIMGRLRGGVDLRAQGSGNVGATNALRTQGKSFALAVLAIDIGKGVLAVTLLPLLPWPLPGAAIFGRTLLPYACGVAVALGHIYPAWFGFRGGKGAATLAGVYAALLGAALPWMLLAFILVLVLTGYAGLATVTGALTALLYVTCFHAQGIFSAPGMFTLAMALLVVYTHRHNLLRVWRGTEHHFEKAMVFRRWLGQ
ncbi:MAG: glycerol-3-phosphate 1-O-acyltransferase PlsY [Hydrocarboniphaga effusa]|nr:glycerol-3-phosphate 1-O-acyltransferase PlsY [Hydrocarboniphaga effusa]